MKGNRPVTKHSKVQIQSKPRKERHTNATPLAIGVDLGDRYSEVCVLDEEGMIASQTRLRTIQTALQEYFSSRVPARVALETGTHSGWVSRLIAGCGHEVVVANARELRKIHQSDRKNDRADAEILARIVRFDPQLLAPVQHRSEQMQVDISLIRARDVLVGARTKLINAARGLTKSLGGRLPRCTTPSFAQRIREQAPKQFETMLAPLAAAIDSLTQQIRCYDKQLEVLAHRCYPETEILQQVAGVGALTSLAFVLTLSDKARFARSRDVGPYLGLVPRQDDSGEHSPQLPITKAGNGYLRRLLIGSAHYIVGPFGPDSELRRFGIHLAERGGKNAKKRAVVAVARKLAVLLHRLWVTAEVYEPLRADVPLEVAGAA
jgi:transposase